MKTGYSESRQLVATMYRTHILFSIYWCGMLSGTLFRTGAATSCRSGKRLNDTHSEVQNAVDGACGSLDIRNSITMLRLLDNCTVVEGTLHISLIDHYNEKDYEQYQFPLLREITGHLLIYRVYGLKTLRHIFPNLAVIRGQDLFYNYALVVYEMPDLEDLGLISLTTIMRGAVRLTKNTRLCYVNTIDWSHIAVGLKDTDHHIQDNKDQTKCVNYCPDNCTKTIVDGENARRCWTAHHCQKNLDCNCKRSNADNPRNCLEGTNKCCSMDCVGGCREVVKDGKRTEQCIACSKLWYQNTCVHKCAPKMATYMNHRCLTIGQCHNLTHATKHNNGWLLYKADSSTWYCVDECPAGYFVNPDERSCEKCNNSCPKICQGRVVDSIDTAQKLKGCNKITNSLEIHIMGGSNIGVELEESLGSIEEVMHDIKIIRSYALMSLYFFKNLRVIHGQSSGSASLVVRDNSNLQELFTEEVTRNLRILKGNVHFHSNRKLCLNKIDDLVKTLGLNVTEHDVSRTTNGDLMPCTVTRFNVTVSKVSSHIALVTWPMVPISDQRQLLSYIIYFREVTTDTVNIYQGRDACSDTIWKTIEISPEDDQDIISHVIPNLKPWTRYAVYVQAQMLSSASSQTISEIQIFRTSPFYPTSPTDLAAVAKQPTELHVSWKPPKFPNGKITHYILYYKMQEIHADSFNQRDYCTNPIAILKEHKTPTEQEQIKNVTTNNSSCCACPKSKEELIEEQKERQIEIEFENYLHDNVYCKREDDIDPSKIDNKYTFDSLKNWTISTISRQQRDTSRVDDPLPHYHTEGNLTLTSNSSTRAPATPASNETQDNTFFQVTILGGATSTVLTNLNHFQEYNIQVVACVDGEVMSNTNSKSDFCSNRVNVDTRTKPLEDADNINGSTVEASAVLNSTGQVIVKWEAPPKPNGLIIKYLIRYRRANTDHQFETVCVSQRSFLIQGGHRLTKIAAGNYTFQIAAISLAGNGSYTPEKFFIVPDKEIDGPAAEIRIVIAVSVISIILIAFIIIVVVWFIAKKRYTNADMTVISQNPGYVPSDELYIPDEWEVPRDKIKLLKELGQGSFGMVYEGKAYDLVDGYSEYKVAIKTVNDNAGFQERMNFLKEATTMKTFKCHHVVKLIGVVSKGQPALVIMELMAKGDLKNYLRMHRPDEEDCAGDPPTTKEILQMAGEIADGMAYLSAKKFVHRDLAARNCMVSENNVVKIGDFGMTRDIYETDYYRKGNKGLLPVRWMAPESLKDGVFTTMSDVWSYGVVMWEMATLACQPYQGLSNEEVVKYVTDGKVMVKPDGCPPKLWSIMEKCWQYRPKNRPTFMSIIEELVPDLDPSFQNVSYFFSEESHGDDGEGARNAILDMEEEEEAAERESMLDEDADDGVDEEFYEGIEDDVDDVRFAGLDSFERDVCVPFISGEEPGHHPFSSSQSMGGGHFSSPVHHSPSHGNRGASSSSWLRGAGASRGPSGLVAGAGAGSGSGSPVECMLLEELPNGHHRFTPPCSSPTSANASSDDSKGSSKSSTGSYSHMNGLANGHIYKPYAPRMKPC